MARAPRENQAVCPAEYTSSWMQQIEPDSAPLADDTQHDSVFRLPSMVVKAGRIADLWERQLAIDFAGSPGPTKTGVSRYVPDRSKRDEKYDDVGGCLLGNMFGI